MPASDRPTTGGQLRELRQEDAERVADIYRAAFGDARPIDAAEISSWFHNTELKPDWLRVLEVDGRVVGYGDIVIERDEVALEVAAPGNWETFIDWAEQRTRDEGLRRVRLFFPAGHELATILERRGYRHWRSAYTMQIELGEGPPQPPGPPTGIDLRAFRPEDAEATRSRSTSASPRIPSSTTAHRQTSASSTSREEVSTRRCGSWRGVEISWPA